MIPPQEKCCTPENCTISNSNFPREIYIPYGLPTTIPIQIAITTSKPYRILGCPSPYFRVIVAIPKPYQSSISVIQPTSKAKGHRKTLIAVFQHIAEGVVGHGLDHVAAGIGHSAQGADLVAGQIVFLPACLHGHGHAGIGIQEAGFQRAVGIVAFSP